MTLWQIWWAALAVKTALLPFIPMTPDEAYYFAWARHPALSYLDHPPFVAWLMTLALPLWKTPLGIRLPGVLFNHIGFIPWFGILSRLGFSKRGQIYWIMAILLGPLTGLGSFIVTPDVPLVFFWSLGLWALLWILEKPETSRWIVLGMILGLGMLSKYMMILFFPATLLLLAWNKQLTLLKKPGPWIATAIAGVVFYPVIYWNQQNHFASFLFQSKHGLTSEHFHWQFPVEYIGAQLGLVNPFLAIVAGWVLWQKPWQTKPLVKSLIVFSAVPLLFFLLTSFRARVEGNWAVCAFPSLVALSLLVLDNPLANQTWNKFIKFGIGFSALFVALIISHAIHPWLPISKNRDHTQIMHEWSADVVATQNYRPLFARSYQMAAFHSYNRPPEDEVFKLSGLDRIDFYDFLKESRPLSKGYIILMPQDKFPDEVKDKYVVTNPRPLPSGLLLFDLAPRDNSLQ